MTPESAPGLVLIEVGPDAAIEVDLGFQNHNVDDLMGYIMKDGPAGTDRQTAVPVGRPRSCGGPSSS
jgi:hypothetical protein